MEHPFLKELGDRIEAEASGMYEVSPQAAYEQAGSPYGGLRPVGRRMGETLTCCGCAQPAAAYSQDGANEVGISEMCEPCFDFVCIPADERNDIEQKWMSIVKHRKDG